jgi:hypothetical protein
VTIRGLYYLKGFRRSTIACYDKVGIRHNGGKGEFSAVGSDGVAGVRNLLMPARLQIERNFSVDSVGRNLSILNGCDEILDVQGSNVEHEFDSPTISSSPLTRALLNSGPPR